MKLFRILTFIPLVVIISGCSNSTKTNVNTNQTANLAVFCKFWGFLKYYDPLIGKEDLNWDSVLIVNIDAVSTIKNQDSLKFFFHSLLPKNHSYSHCDSIFSCEEDSILYININLDWIHDTNIFLSETSKYLSNIRENRIPYDNKYISENQYVKNPIFDNDTLYYDGIFPKKNIRLLALFRYWNIINYYYPYKYLTDVPWEEVLERFIPKFISATDTLSYHLAVCELSGMINDSHGYTGSPIIENHLGTRFLPVKFSFVENTTLISDIYSDSLASINNLQLGDIILELDGRPDNFIRDSLSVLFSGSNRRIIDHNISFYLSRSSKSKIQLLIERDDSVITVLSNTYSRKTIAHERLKNIQTDPIRYYNEHICYIDLSKLNYDNVDSVFLNNLESNVLILDLRNNCHFILHNIGEILLKQAVTFYSVSTPCYEYPGTFQYKIGDKSGPEYFNPNFYKGRIILLVNENTQSIGEFTLMLLSKLNMITVIGSTTSGADGNVSVIYLPGKITTYFSGIGIYWPDGRQTQRVGISPDIEVYPKRGSIKIKQDDVLQRALEYAVNK